VVGAWPLTRAAPADAPTVSISKYTGVPSNAAAVARRLDACSTISQSARTSYGTGGVRVGGTDDSVSYRKPASSRRGRQSVVAGGLIGNDSRSGGIAVSLARRPWLSRFTSTMPARSAGGSRETTMPYRFGGRGSTGLC